MRVPSHPIHYDHRTILIELEASYGVDAGLTLGAAQACRLYDVQVEFLQVDEKELPYVLPYMGNRGSIFTGKRNTLTAKVPLVGIGAASSGVPAWDVFARACGMARTQIAKTAAATIAAVAVAGAGTAGVFTYTRTAAFAGTIDRTATLTCTTGGASGVAAFTVSAPADGGLAAYNATGVVMTTATPFALPNGATITPTAITTDFEVGDTHTIALSAAGCRYEPSSDRAGHKSAALHFRLDDPGGQHQKFAMLGTRGALKLSANVNEYPYLELSLTSLWTAPALAATVGADFSEWPDPIEVSTANTPMASLFGNELVVEQFGFDTGNQVELVERVGRRAVRINDRKSTFTMKAEAPGLAEADFWAYAEGRTKGVLAFQHGVEAGAVVRFDASAAQIGAPKISESKKDLMFDLTGKLLPVVGDDEWTLHAHLA